MNNGPATLKRLNTGWETNGPASIYDGIENVHVGTDWTGCPILSSLGSRSVLCVLTSDVEERDETVSGSTRCIGQVCSYCSLEKSEQKPCIRQDRSDQGKEAIAFSACVQENRLEEAEEACATDGRS